MPADQLVQTESPLVCLPGHDGHLPYNGIIQTLINTWKSKSPKLGLKRYVLEW